MSREHSLSIVVPVHDEATRIGETLARAANAADRADRLTYELIVVDDGSIDGTDHAASAALAGRRGRLISQSNQGRYRARRAGLHAATGEYVLFLDSRVRIEPDSLRFVAAQLELGRRVWNAHVHIETTGNAYGGFWKVLTDWAFWTYFGEPRTTSYGPEDFDAFPKGTTCFLAPRRLLLAAFDRLRTRYADERHANDDTPIIRWIAHQERIWISPSFACHYTPRSTLPKFLRHAHHRGIVFLDGHGRPESRLFPAVVAFYPMSVALGLLALRRPAWAVTALAAIGAGGGALALSRGEARRDVASFAALAPVYAAGHGAGMWHGLALLLAGARRGLSIDATA